VSNSSRRPQYLVGSSIHRPLSRLPLAPSSHQRSSLALAERITIVFFVYFTLAAFWLCLNAPQRFLILALNIVTVTTFVALGHAHLDRRLASTRYLFPVVIILLAYRESGLFLRPDTTRHLDRVFIDWDRALLQSGFTQALLHAGAPWAQHYLEFAYLFCYPLVPLGVAAIQFAPRPNHSAKVNDYPIGRAMDDFWGTVLLATLFCYAVTPYIPLTPPRVLFHDVPGPHIEPLVRRWNFWVLNHYSVQACVFPSAHVATVTSVALVVRKHASRLGGLFLFLAASVAVATIYGRYHYTADAIAGGITGLAAYTIVEFLRAENRHAQSALTSDGKREPRNMSDAFLLPSLPVARPLNIDPISSESSRRLP